MLSKLKGQFVHLQGTLHIKTHGGEHWRAFAGTAQSQNRSHDPPTISFVASPGIVGNSGKPGGAFRNNM
jgi:hypothetical protein